MNRIDDTAVIGEYCVIGDNVAIGKNSVIGHHTVIHADSVIGEGVRIDDFACIGKKPTKAKNSAVTKNIELSPCVIGDYCSVGTSAIIYRGARIKNDCLVADMAVVREKVAIGENTIVGKGVTIENECSIGAFVKLQTNTYITAYSVVEDYCFIAPCVVTTNDNYAGRDKERLTKFKGVTVKRGGRIGAGAVILPGKTVNEDSLVGAGSVLTGDTQEKKTYIGAPARQTGDVKESQLLENQ